MSKELLVEVYHDIANPMTVSLPDWPAEGPTVLTLLEADQMRAVEVCQWLVSLGHNQVHQPKAFRLVIKEERPGRKGYDTRVAVVYTQTMTYGLCGATINGKRKVGQKYNETKIYVLGDKLRTFREDTAYTIPGNDGDWYVAAYSPANVDLSHFTHAHPFGANFILARWPQEEFGEVIDAHERKYTRFPMYLLPL